MRSFLVLVAFLTACSSSATPDTAPSTAVEESAGAEQAKDEIQISLSLYVLTDADDPDSGLSSRRSIDELQAIAKGVQGIWQPAGIVFDPINLQTIAVPTTVLAAIAQSGDTQPFFSQVGRDFPVPEPGLINGFYTAAAAGVNGFTPIGSSLFFVVDEPSVHDERVSSHEIGHILGLRHTTEDAGRLMFSGTNGMTLTDQEQEVARYGAQGLVNAGR